MARWSIDIKRWTDRAKGDLNKAVRIMSLEIFAKIIVRSPVDTGRFRGNWMIGITVVPEGSTYTGGLSKTEGGDPGANAGSAMANALAQGDNLANFKIGDVVHFRNNLPYAVRLEKGHSEQAPAGVVKVTLIEFGAISRRAVRKARAGG